MHIADAAARAFRIRARRDDDWDFGTAFWATDGADVKLLTAPHIFKKFGYPHDCDIDYWSRAYGAFISVGCSTIIYADGDPTIEIARLVPPGDLVEPSDPFQIRTDVDLYALAIGFPGSLNTDATGVLTEPHVNVVRGKRTVKSPIQGARKLWNAIFMQTIIEPGYSGGPLLPLMGKDGKPPTNVKEVEERSVFGHVVGICWGEHTNRPDETAFTSIEHFDLV